MDNLHAAYREGLLAGVARRASAIYRAIFRTVRDLLQPFMHSVTTSDGVFGGIFSYGQQSPFIFLMFQPTTASPSDGGCLCRGAHDDAELWRGPPTLSQEGFAGYLQQMMAEEAVTVGTSWATRPTTDKAVGYPIVPALLLSLQPAVSAQQVDLCGLRRQARR